MLRLDRVKIISLLAEKDMQKQDLANAAGINRNTVSAICNGRSCSLNTGIKIAAALGVQVEDLAVRKGV